MKTVAFFGHTNPLGPGFALRAANELKRIFFAAAGRRAGGALGAVSLHFMVTASDRI